MNASKIVIGEGIAVVAMTTLSSLHNGKGFPAPKVFLAGAVAYGTLALLAGPAPELAITLGALGVAYGALRTNGKGVSLGESAISALTGIGGKAFETPGSQTTAGSSLTFATPSTGTTGVTGATGAAGATGTTGGNTPAGTGTGPVFGGGTPVPSSDGGNPYASVPRAASLPVPSAKTLIGRPYEGTHLNYGNWESDNAIDIQEPTGTPVFAVAAGTIGPASQFGAINSSDPHLAGERLHLVTPGNEFYYQHLSSIVVKPNQQVAVGQILGYTGATNHLHFAVKNGSPLQILGLT